MYKCHLHSSQIVFYFRDNGLPEEHLKMPSRNSKVGRRNIRDVLDDSQMTEASRLAAKEEKMRVRRLSDRNEKVIDYLK